MKTKAYQDGGQFYDSETGELIVDYGFLVKGDYDTEGAAAARKAFLEKFPAYEME